MHRWICSLSQRLTGKVLAQQLQFLELVTGVLMDGAPRGPWAWQPRREEGHAVQPGSLKQQRSSGPSLIF